MNGTCYGTCPKSDITKSLMLPMHAYMHPWESMAACMPGISRCIDSGKVESGRARWNEASAQKPHGDKGPLKSQ